MIVKRMSITLTGTFKKNRIPIGGPYSAERLGLIAILEDYAARQRKDALNWIHQLDEDQDKSFLHRIYRKRTSL